MILIILPPSVMTPFSVPIGPGSRGCQTPFCYDWWDLLEDDADFEVPLVMQAKPVNDNTKGRA